MKNNDSRINGMGYLNFEQSHIRMGQNSDHHKPVFDLMLLKQNPPAPNFTIFYGSILPFIYGCYKVLLSGNQTFF